MTKRPTTLSGNLGSFPFELNNNIEHFLLEIVHFEIRITPTCLKSGSSPSGRSSASVMFEFRIQSLPGSPNGNLILLLSSLLTDIELERAFSYQTLTRLNVSYC